MTDESMSPDAEGESEGAPEASPPAAESATGGFDDFTSGEGLVALGGMVLLAAWIIFDVFLDDFGFSEIELLLAFVVVITPRMRRETVEKIMPLGHVMKLAGYALAVIGAVYIIAAIESGFYEGASTIIAALVSFAAYAMAFIGARSIHI